MNYLLVINNNPIWWRGSLCVMGSSYRNWRGVGFQASPSSPPVPRYRPLSVLGAQWENPQPHTRALCSRGGRLWRSNLHSRAGVKWVICLGDPAVLCPQASHFRLGGSVTWVCRARLGVRRRCERKGTESKSRLLHPQGPTRCRYRWENRELAKLSPFVKSHCKKVAESEF